MCSIVRGQTYAADAIVFGIIFRLLDHIPSNDGLVAMVAVLLVRDKVDFAQELLLVMLEFPDHGESVIASPGLKTDYFVTVIAECTISPKEKCARQKLIWLRQSVHIQENK